MPENPPLRYRYKTPSYISRCIRRDGQIRQDTEHTHTGSRPVRSPYILPTAAGRASYLIDHAGGVGTYIHTYMVAKTIPLPEGPRGRTDGLGAALQADRRSSQLAQALQRGRVWGAPYRVPHYCGTALYITRIAADMYSVPAHLPRYVCMYVCNYVVRNSTQRRLGFSSRTSLHCQPHTYITAVHICIPSHILYIRNTSMLHLRAR